MYTSAAQVWNGLAKNATEGLASPTRILPITLLFLLGQVAPFLAALILISLAAFITVVLAGNLNGGTAWSGSALLPSMLLLLVVASIAFAWLPRILGAKRFQQSRLSALLHPIGILLLLAVQWYALIRKLLGNPVSWRGRAYQRGELPPPSKSM
jgi:hypothetical protein